MRKRCPDHGWFESLVSADAEGYVNSLKFNKPGTIPLEFATEVQEGCPKDCGLCPEYKQHTCLALIEVNTACNVDLAISSTDLARRIFAISVKDFMDADTFDVKKVMKCCVGMLTPDGRTIPFCAYNNVGYREEVRQALRLEQVRTRLTSR
jgi:uncharacterized radical SAM superfamily Fe-S cluster-containing enzyme